MGDPIAKHTTQEAARAACGKSTECGCIQDLYCEGDYWILSKGSDVSSSGSGTCAWIKSKLTFPLHTRGLTYFIVIER